jgi:cobalamin synthase
MKDKMMITLGLSLVILVLISLTAYVAFMGMIDYGEFATVAVVAVLVAFAAYVMWDRARSVSKGLPAADERLKNVNYKAGYYGFIAAIWSAVFAPVLGDILLGYELEGHLVTAVVVIVAGFVFAASYLYLARKGN